jgi:endogenous inhibitor of DNA gyrase (YacG/DUF329 family)
MSELVTCKLDGCENQFAPVAIGTPREKKFCCTLHREKWHSQKASRQKLDAREAREKDPSQYIVCGRPDCTNKFLPTKLYADGSPYRKFCSRRCKEVANNDYDRQGRIAERLEKESVTSEASNDELISEMHKRGYFVTKTPQATDEKFKVAVEQFEGDTLRFGVCSDPHLCSKYQQLTHFRTFYRLCADQGIKQMFNLGDICEGTGKQHRGQEFELHTHGCDEQLDYMVEYYPREEGMDTYFIGGSHDNSFFKAGGYDICRALGERREDLHYLGVHGAYVDIAPKVRVYLHHPDGGTAYALSYSTQRIVENFSPETKPNIYLTGHYHRYLHMMWRNVDSCICPAFQAQTPFLKAKNIQPVIGGLIVEVVVGKKGLLRFKDECIRFYEPIEDDY